MAFDRDKIDAEFEALLSQDTFGDFDFTFADEVEVSEVTGASEEQKEVMARLEKLILPIFRRQIVISHAIFCPHIMSFYKLEADKTHA